MENGDLLQAAEKAGFEILVTPDQNIRYQQNLTDRKIALVVLTNSTWRIVQPQRERIAEAVNEATPGSYAEVDIPRQ